MGAAAAKVFAGRGWIGGAGALYLTAQSAQSGPAIVSEWPDIF